MGQEVLDLLSSRAGRSGVFLDFDGTLSEIAPTPDAASAVPGASEVLAGLARRFRKVAVVSGRMVREVEDRLGHPQGVGLFGLYGAEQLGVEAGGAGPRAVEAILPRVLEVATAIPGSLVEPKGPNVAVHYRGSSEPEMARRALVKELEPLAAGAGMKVIEGKRVLELVPLSMPTKGDLIAREGAELQAILYAGDDIADLEAFSAIDRLVAAGTAGVRIAVRSAETPPALVDAADIVVEGPSGLLELLRSLVPDP